MFGFIKKSNRVKHLVYAIPSAFLFTILFAAGLAVGMEFKDREHGGLWDWLDLIATLMGGAIGQLLQCLVIYLVMKGGVS